MLETDNIQQYCPSKISKFLLPILLLTSSYICISIITYPVKDHMLSHVVTYHHKITISQQVMGPDCPN